MNLEKLFESIYFGCNPPTKEKLDEALENDVQQLEESNDLEDLEFARILRESK
jgi:hypothetical protein